MKINGRPVELPVAVVIADAARKIGDVGLLNAALVCLRDEHGVKLSFVRPPKLPRSGGAPDVHA